MTSETRKFLDDYLEFMPKSRNASLASIGTISVGIEKGEATREDLFLACKRYIDCHSQKLYVFSDLCQVIDSDKTALSQVLAYLFSGKEVGEKVSFTMCRHQTCGKRTDLDTSGDCSLHQRP